MLRFVAFVVILVMLAGCSAAPAPTAPVSSAASPAQAAPAAPSPAPQGPLTTRVEKLGYLLQFTLAGYMGTNPPTITVRSATGAVYADNAPASAGGVYELDTVDRKELVADQLTYTWNTPDGRTVTGDFLYTNPLTRFKWQVTETAHLVMYHTAPLAEGEAAQLEGAAQRSSDLVGVPLPERRIGIYHLPDQQSLIELDTQLGVDTPPSTIKGFSYPGNMFIRGDLPVEEKDRVVAHEVVHTLGSFHNLLILAEGLPEYAQQLEMARLTRETGFQFERRQQNLDNLTHLTETLKLGGPYNRIVLDRVPLMEPQAWNAYTVGCAFMLFVRSKYGDDGIRKLFSLYRQDSTNILVIKEIFDESFASIQTEFNTYLKSGQALQDTRTLFGFPE